MLLTCYVFPQGLRMVLIQANSSPSLSMPRWELLLPVWMLLTSWAKSPPPRSPQPPGRVTLPVWTLLAFSQGLRMVLIQRTRRPPFPCPGGSCSFLYECYVRVVRAHLHPPPPSHRGELPFLYECNLRIVYFPRGFVFHPQPPGGVSLSCVNVAYTVSFPRGCARCWFKRTRLQVGSHWSHERR